MRSTISLLTLLAFESAIVSAQPSSPFRLIDADTLPDVVIDGETVKIHTQGLYVTNQDYIVTGRIETPPRRPIVLRFNRDSPANYQALSLKPLAGPKGGLDHPGGFDRDADGVFWIPLLTSHPLGPTKLVGFRLQDGELPDDASEISRMIDVPDHLGAVCCLPNQRLLAANWDTRTVYLIDSASGEILEKFNYRNFFANNGTMRLAVQDWKYDPATERVIAGGLDKSPDRRPTQPRAVVAVVDAAKRALTAIHRLSGPAGVSKAITNEGLALHDGDLFLIPEDIGRGAKVFRYGHSQPAEVSP